MQMQNTVFRSDGCEDSKARARGHRLNRLRDLRVLSAFFFAIAMCSWSAPASAGTNFWSWAGYPAYGYAANCKSPGLDAMVDCWVAYIQVHGSSAYCEPCRFLRRPFCVSHAAMA
jgi:hypothetical protein